VTAAAKQTSDRRAELLLKEQIMKTSYISTICIGAAIVLFGVGLPQTHAAPPGGTASDDGVQVLTRGPVHEAFAETVVFNPKPGIVVAKTPPAAIEEIPPDQRPEGANVAWIPGYWGWDDERNDFLWVSGIWRDLPPGRQWIPGYWGGSGQGSQWTSGYWADAKASEVEYLPEPPATVEAGPNVAAPSAEDSWLPGSWIWRQSRYAWRPGNWEAARPNWVWIPAHYVWAPRGFLFVDGYWDYSVDRRGMLFAPVFFDASVYSRRGFFYSPTTVIDSGVFSDQLFLRPSYNHYYFGDYYAAGYAGAGFYPSFSYASGGYGYDPIFAQQRWEHRGDSGWGRQVQATFQDRRDHQDARPPRTLIAQNAFVAGAGNSSNRGFVAATSLDQLAKRPNGSLRLQPVTKEEQQQFAQHGQAVQKFSENRQGLEAKGTKSPTDALSKGSEPSRVKLPLSPLASRPVDQLSKDNAPPRTQEVLKPDLNSEPKPRAEAQPRSNLEPQPKQRVETQPRPALEPEPKPRVEPQPRSTLEPQPQPRPTLQPEPQPKPRAEPQPRPALEPQPKPKAEPRPTPAPQPTPKAEPQPRPAPAPAPTPKAEPRPSPSPQPQPKPAGDPNEKPKK
jgi:hypothetical protein